MPSQLRWLKISSLTLRMVFPLNFFLFFGTLLGLNLGNLVNENPENNQEISFEVTSFVHLAGGGKLCLTITNHRLESSDTHDAIGLRHVCRSDP